MSRRSPRWLVVVAGLAVVIELVGVAGWLSWRRFVRVLEDNPPAGAELLARDPWLRLPPAVRRARRFPGRRLALADDEAVVPALNAIGRDQIRWFPADPRGFVNRARATLIEGELEEALVDLDAGVLRDPTSPDIHRLMALTERARGRNPQALEHLAVAQGLGPRDLPLGLELTPEEESWVRLEGLERRLSYYPRARSGGVIALARELRVRDRKELGREFLEGESGDPRVALELARWDMDAGRMFEAESRLADLASRRGLPASLQAETWTVTAMVRDRMGDVDGVVVAAEMALAYDPRSAGPYRVLANLAERRGDVDAALAQLRRAWGMNPTDISLLMSVARVAEKAGQLDDARLALERAVSVDPDNPALRARLVDFHLRHGDFMQATVTLSDALDRFPTDPALLRLADRLRADVSRR